MNGITIDLREVAKRIGAFIIQEKINGEWVRLKYGDMDSGTYIGRNGAETDFNNMLKNPKNNGRELRIHQVEL